MIIKPKLRLTQGQDSNTFVIRDYIQKYFDTTNLPILKEIILLTTMYLFYINAESKLLISAFKYCSIIFILRYILSKLTHVTNTKTNRHYFQINANVVIFSIIIFLMMGRNDLYEFILISSYSLLVISTKEHYTSDVIITVLLVHYVLRNNYIAQYI